MSRYTANASFAHGTPRRSAVLLVQLGTPDAPTAPALRRYLREFLSDRRVVEIPRWLWMPILYGIILTTRPKKSAMKYASIWSEQGSPLRVYTERQTTLLRGLLGERGHAVDVAYAMRYGSPSIPAVLRELRERNLERLLVLPLYPQYAASTTATVYDAVLAELARWRDVPELRLVRHFHDDAAYIDALAQRIRRAWEGTGSPDRLVMSFHGVPRRSLDLGDPYHCECLKTGRLLAERLGLAEDQFTVSFQSRFGRARWLEPYTAPTLQALARQGVARVDVVCPGFVSDCLETLEEIALEAKEDFLTAGGGTFRYIPCLNDAPEFIAALADLVERQLAGWPTQRLDPDRAEQRDAELAAQKARALALGAKR